MTDSLLKRIVKIKKTTTLWNRKAIQRSRNIQKITSHIINKRLTTHPQAIYTPRLLNPFTEVLPKNDNIDNNSLGVFDFTLQWK